MYKRQAPDYAAAKAAFLDEQTLNKHVDTLANLASIRNTIEDVYKRQALPRDICSVLRSAIV